MNNQAYLLSGDRTKAFSLIGEARRFIHQIELYTQEAFYKRNEVLEDGSVITAILLPNGQRYAYITGAGGAIVEDKKEIFILEANILDEEVIFREPLLDDPEQAGGRVVFDDLSFEPSATINTENNGGGGLPLPSDFAGNVDWRKGSVLISWMGPYGRYTFPLYWLDDPNDLVAEDFSSNFLFLPQGYSLSSEQPASTIACTDVTTFTMQIGLNSPTFRDATLFGLRRSDKFLYADKRKIASTDDITDITTTGTVTVLGAGMYLEQLLCIVFDSKATSEVYLYEIDVLTDTWTRIDTIDHSETDWIHATVYHTYMISQDGTKMCTMLEKCATKVITVGPGTVLRVFDRGIRAFSIGAVAPARKHETVEYTFTITGNKVSGVSAPTVINTTNFVETIGGLDASTSQLDGDKRFVAVDYRDNELATIEYEGFNIPRKLSNRSPSYVNIIINGVTSNDKYSAPFLAAPNVGFNIRSPYQVADLRFNIIICPMMGRKVIGPGVPAIQTLSNVVIYRYDPEDMTLSISEVLPEGFLDNEGTIGPDNDAALVYRTPNDIAPAGVDQRLPNDHIRVFPDHGNLAIALESEEILYHWDIGLVTDLNFTSLEVVDHKYKPLTYFESGNENLEGDAASLIKTGTEFTRLTGHYSYNPLDYYNAVLTPDVGICAF